MIHYLPDFVTLEGEYPPGTTWRRSPRDEGFMDAFNIMSEQQAAANANTVLSNAYMNALHNYQTNVDIGRAEGLTAPPKPLMTVIDDGGNKTVVAFEPPLPDPVYPNVNQAGPPVDKPAPDRTDVLIALVTNLGLSLQKIAAKLGV